MSELKKKIDGILGNSIRCLLPSYWWKRLFGMVVDEVDAAKKAVSNKQDKLVSGTNIKTINGEDVLGVGDITINTKSTIIIYCPAISYDYALTSYEINANKEAYTKVWNALALSNPVNVLLYGKGTSNPLFYSPDTIGILQNTTKISLNIYTYGGTLYMYRLSEDGTITVSWQDAIYDSSLSTTSIKPVQNKVVTAALNNKVDKVSGKQLTTEDFTTALKTKLEGLNNYDDTALASALNTLSKRVDNIATELTEDFATKEELQTSNETLTNDVIDDEEVLAHAINDLKSMIDALIARVDALESNNA